MEEERQSSSLSLNNSGGSHCNYCLEWPLTKIQLRDSP